MLNGRFPPSQIRPRVNHARQTVECPLHVSLAGATRHAVDFQHRDGDRRALEIRRGHASLTQDGGQHYTWRVGDGRTRTRREVCRWSAAPERWRICNAST